MLWRITRILLLLTIAGDISAQTCTNLGQTPATAFPVCGTSSFDQASVPICSLSDLPVPGCGGGYPAKNPYWYRFTCFQGGTLSFLITPKDMNDDYDWMLYDITNRDPNQVYNNESWIVTGNWAGTYGLTGASASGVDFIQCGSDPGDRRNTFSKMPTLVQGHTYLLMISHFTDTQSGYSLSFGGGTAVITDPTLPGIKEASAHCSGTTVRVNFNKKMKCNSLAANGSDFTLSPGGYTITAATGIGCSASFDMESVELTLSSPLAPGTYTLTTKNGSDGNTLLDNCDRPIAVGESVSFVLTPMFPTPMDSLTTPGCAPGILELVFRKPILCSSIAADGSDFRVTGTAPVTVVSASGNCTGGFTNTISVQLSKPIEQAGSFQIELVQGSDGNTIIDECLKETPVGDVLPFTTRDTVNADFTYQMLYGCARDTVQFSHDGRNGVNRYTWNFDGIGNSFIQHPSFIFPSFGEKQVTLIVSNGVCADTSASIVNLDNALHADFAYPEIVCPDDQVVFTDRSTGNIISYSWDFGDGFRSIEPTPAPKQYPRLTGARTRGYTVKLVVENDHHCFDTAVHQLTVVNSCYVEVPNAFTPNNDGKNDQLYPLNAYKATDLDFRIFNRYGQLIFQTSNWTRKWDGTFNGRQQATGVYVWMLRYTDWYTGQKVFKKGTTVLIR